MLSMLKLKMYPSISKLKNETNTCLIRKIWIQNWTEMNKYVFFWYFKLELDLSTILKFFLTFLLFNRLRMLSTEKWWKNWAIMNMNKLWLMKLLEKLTPFNFTKKYVISTCLFCHLYSLYTYTMFQICISQWY